MFLFVITPVVLVGCTTVPDKSDLARMDRNDLRSTVVGNTYTHLTDYGRWAEYVQSLDAGHGRASGSWGSESAAAKYTIATDGEWCTVYSGKPDWAGSEYEFCSVFYTDGEGNIYSETTTNTWKPGREGQIQQIEIRAGDHYGLASK